MAGYGIPTAANPSPAMATGFYANPANRGKSVDELTAALPQFSSWEQALADPTVASLPSDEARTNYLRDTYGLSGGYGVQNGQIVSTDHSLRNGLLGALATIGGPLAAEGLMGAGGAGAIAGTGLGDAAGVGAGTAAAGGGMNAGSLLGLIGKGTGVASGLAGLGKDLTGAAAGSVSQINQGAGNALQAAQFTSNQMDRAKRNALGSSLLSNIQDVNVTGLSPRIPVAQYSGGLRPSALTGNDANRQSLLAMLAKNGAAVQTPDITPGAATNALGAAGLGTTILGRILPLLNQQQAPQQGPMPLYGPDGLPY